MLLDQNNWYQQPSAILRWFAAMTTFLDSYRLITFLPHILSPVYRVSVDDTIRESHMGQLIRPDVLVLS